MLIRLGATDLGSALMHPGAQRSWTLWFVAGAKLALTRRGSMEPQSADVPQCGALPSNHETLSLSGCKPGVSSPGLCLCKHACICLLGNTSGLGM